MSDYWIEVRVRREIQSQRLIISLNGMYKTSVCWQFGTDTRLMNGSLDPMNAPLQVIFQRLGQETKAEFKKFSLKFPLQTAELKSQNSPSDLFYWPFENEKEIYLQILKENFQ